MYMFYFLNLFMGWLPIIYVMTSLCKRKSPTAIREILMKMMYIYLMLILLLAAMLLLLEVPLYGTVFPVMSNVVITLMFLKPNVKPILSMFCTNQLHASPFNYFMFLFYFYLFKCPFLFLFYPSGPYCKTVFILNMLPCINIFYK